MASGVAGMALRRRADKVTDGGCQDKVLANAPEARDGYFVVPKVIE
jgi:aspartyl-tRNA(Asn)/glutamyl-tRNA(Gln) amidotransferase subunit C